MEFFGHLRDLKPGAAVLAGLALIVIAAAAPGARAQDADTQAQAAQEEVAASDETAGDETEAEGETTEEAGDGAGESEPGAVLDEGLDGEGVDGEGVDGDGLDAAGDGEAEGSEDAEDATARDWGRFQPLADLVEAGGPIIVILGALSVLSLAIAAVKLVQFFVLRPGDYGFVRRVAKMLADGDDDGALDLVSRRRGVVARVMEAALRGRKLGADGAQLREEVERVARMKLDGLESGLAFLSLIATISPLLGLLGTVLGMIEAFQQLETAGDRVDPAILSGGIWEALLTTAAGLSVAIPAAALYTWLQRTVDVAGQHMEDAATRVFTAGIYVDGGAKRTARGGDVDED